MKVIYSKYLPPKGYSAINLFGFILFRKDQKDIIEKYPSIKAWLLNHESIHTKQMQEMLFIFFYLWYGLEWLIRWVAYGFNAKKAYNNILFEREAYNNDNNLEYLKERKLFSWLRLLFTPKNKI